MFRKVSDFYRLLYINYVLARYGVGRAVLSVHPRQPWTFLSYLNPFYWFSRKRSRGESVRVALQTLGPIFVKFGQTLSTRRDFIPDDIADELEQLVDNVPGFSGTSARKRVEKSLGRSIDEMFASFELEPMASASIAQVHRAVLLDGSEVAIKVLRPNIKRTIQRDIRLMYFVASLVQRFYSEGYRLKPVELVREFETTLIDELDMMREGSNASQLRRNFTDSPLLVVPKVYWDVTSDDILATEMIYGTPITDVSALRSAKMDMKKLAEYGVEIFFTQVFRDSFFHADMHRGNIFVSTRDPQNPKYMAVDFGIMGVLSPSDQRYLAENLLAFFKRDYRQVAVLHVESGWVPADTRVEEFESAIRAVCEPIFERPLNEISFGQLLMRLFQTASRFKMEIQPQLMLLQKTLLSVEGIGRQLYPELDLWTTAKPFLEKWLRERVSVKALFKNTLEKAPFWAEKAVDVPDMLYKLLEMRTHLLPTPVVQEPEKPVAAKAQFPGVAVGVALVFAAAVSWFFQAEPMHTRAVLEVGVASFGVLLAVFGWAYR